MQSRLGKLVLGKEHKIMCRPKARKTAQSVLPLTKPFASWEVGVPKTHPLFTQLFFGVFEKIESVFLYCSNKTEYLPVQGWHDAHATNTRPCKPNAQPTTPRLFSSFFFNSHDISSLQVMYGIRRVEQWQAKGYPI
jgi:hypothetical protein